MTAASLGRKVNQLSLIFHVRKTVALASALLHDARVHWFSKLLFIGSVASVLLAVLFPELLADAVAAVGLPGIGPIFDLLGLPVDATIDWVAFAVATYNLLRLFPPDIVGEHHDRLFHSRRGA
jgi:hypothetical protein